MFRRLGKRALFVLASVAVLSWGLAGAVPAAHGAGPKPAPQSTQSHDHGQAHGHVAPVADAGDTANDQTGGNQDRCCPPGCSFAAMTPVPFGAVVHVLAVAPVFAPNSVAPESGAAPPLRPPRIS